MDDMPGYLGWTSQGVVAIHADWPIYPLEHGWEAAIISLGNFPIGTRFAPIDDIDQCLLLLAEYDGRHKDPLGPGALHVAVWHEDLVEAADLGLVSGMERSTERQHIERWLDTLPSDLRRSNLEALPLTEFDDEYESCGP